MEVIGIDGWSSNVRFVRFHSCTVWDGGVVQHIVRVWASSANYGAANDAV